MLYVIIGILCILSLLVIRHILRIMRAGRKMERIEKAALIVRIATFTRLENRYKLEYGSQAPLLARAVTNELFSDTSPDDSRANVFLKKHKDVVEKELTALRGDTHLLTLANITLSQEIGIRHARGASAEQIEETFNKLKRYGLIVPVEPATINKFVELAHDFFDENRSD